MAPEAGRGGLRPPGRCGAACSRGTAARPRSPRRTRRTRPPRSRASTMVCTTSAARASSRLRVSSSTTQRSATTLAAVPPSISAHVGGGLRVQPPVRHRGDRPRRGGDGVAARLGADAGVSGVTQEARLEAVVGRARPRPPLRSARRGRTRSRTRSAGRSMSTAFAPSRARSSQVVKSSSTPTGEPRRPRAGARCPGWWPPPPCCRRRGSPRCGSVSAPPSCTTFDRRRERNRVQVGAQQDRPGRPRARRCARGGCRRPTPCPTALVLLDLEPELAEVGGHRVGHRPLALGRALDLAQAYEVGDQALALGRSGAADCCAHRRKATRERARRATRPAPPAPPRELGGRRARALCPRTRGRAAAGAADAT